MSNYMILQSDARRIPLADKSVHCVTTSPPYFGLRDYGTEKQIGLESTPQEYVDTIRKVFAEVWRVLRDDGTLWLNLGDSYFGGGYSNHRINGEEWKAEMNGDKRRSRQQDLKRANPDIKPKDLVGIPWRVAFALQSDGFYLRSDIIWHKPSPMPESVTDRPTKAHEYVFLLTKGERYFYDADAVKEASKYPEDNRKARQSAAVYDSMMGESGQIRAVINPLNPTTYPTKNLRSVWTIASQPYPGAHFATMPIDLATRCIKAGTSEKGCCPHCGSPYQRITERTQVKRERPNDYVKRSGEDGTGNSCANTVAGVDVKTVGWERKCGCPDAKPVPCVVLDPFSGAATTGVAALALNRDYIGLENNPEYIAQSVHRIERPHAKATTKATTHDASPLFEGLTL